MEAAQSHMHGRPSETAKRGKRDENEERGNTPILVKTARRKSGRVQEGVTDNVAPCCGELRTFNLSPVRKHPLPFDLCTEVSLPSIRQTVRACSIERREASIATLADIRRAWSGFPERHPYSRSF